MKLFNKFITTTYCSFQLNNDLTASALVMEIGIRLKDNSRSNSCTNISVLGTEFQTKVPKSNLRRKYSAEFLYHIKEKPISREPPACLDAKFFDGGFWDPQKWVASFEQADGSGDASGNPDSCVKKSGQAEDSRLSKLQNEDSIDIVLSPQRRSFGGGCKVSFRIYSVSPSVFL